MAARQRHLAHRLYRWLPVFDALLIIGAVYLAHFLRFADPPPHGSLLLRAALIAGTLVVAITVTGLYNLRLREGLEGIVVRQVISFGMAAVLLGAVFYLLPALFLGRGVLALALSIAFSALVIERAYLLRLLGTEGFRHRVLVLGAGDKASTLTRFRRRTDLIGIKIVGYLPFPGDRIAVPEDRLVSIEEPLWQWALAHGIWEVVVCPDERRQGLDIRQLLDCKVRGVIVSDIATFIEREAARVRLDIVDPSWLVFSRGFQSTRLSDATKRVFDVVISVILVILTAPIQLLAAAAIWVDGGFRGPVIYRQRRVGAQEREFDLYKFRSMRPDAEADGKARWAQEKDPRVTRIGGFLRRYRIDELPQLWNILKGDMSFVGPRPERPEFVRQLEERLPHYAERHTVKPGLTGWAQVSHPYTATEAAALDKLEYDLYYVKNRSIVLDLTVLAHTAEVVLWGRGAR